MLNNQADETKQMRSNLLRMYKQEMMGHEERKTQEKQQRINEEKRYLERQNLQDQEDRLKKQNAKSNFVNQRMEEYQNFLTNKQGNKNKNKYPQIGMNVAGQENKNPNVFVNDLTPNNLNLESNSPQQMYGREENQEPLRYGDISEPNSYRDIPRKEETLKQTEYPSINNNYDKPYNTIDVGSNLPNLNNNNYSSNNYASNNNSNYINNNNNNLNSNNTNNYSNNTNPNPNPNPNPNNNYYNPQLSDQDLANRSKKFEQQLQYKNFLDSQVSTNRSNRSQSSAKVYENRHIPKRNNEPSINPFSTKNYEFGSSNLNVNPILNPMNNYGYNKYITPSHNQGQSFKLPSSDKLKRAANNIIG
jgi:hypothetical protein